MKLKSKPLAWLLGLGLLASYLALPVAQADWQPRKPVEFVIMAGKGGGADKMARLMQSIIEKHNLASKPFVPVNKAGGSGAEALLYMKQRKNDDHVVMVTLNSFYTTPLRQPNIKVSRRQLSQMCLAAVSPTAQTDTVEDPLLALSRRRRAHSPLLIRRCRPTRSTNIRLESRSIETFELGAWYQTTGTSRIE